MSSAGAIFHNGDGDLTINDSIVTDHSGPNGPGAIRGAKAASTLTINRSVIAGNSSATGAGGAINQTGPLVIEDSYVYDNHAPASAGGAVVGLDDITVRRSLFERNSADTIGGIYGQSSGTTTVVSNSTFIDNDTTGTFVGGAAISAPNVQIDQSTFAGNDGTATGVAQIAFLSNAPDDHSITRSVLLDPGADDKNCGGSILRTTGYTYSTDATCTGSGGVATGDVEAGTDPQLGPLRDNGGRTPSRFPLSGSPLIDAVPVDDCTQIDDQRSVVRPFPAGGPCDIGAVEAVFPPYSFSDVTPFYEATVRWITSDVNTPNILDGYDNGTFRHKLDITRGQAARLYYRAAGEPDVSGEDPHGFGDVTPFYEAAVTWAKANGLVNGYGDNTFRQKNAITRGDAGRTAYNLAQTPSAWADAMVAPNNMLFRSNLPT